MTELITCGIMLIGLYWLCKKDEWKASHRLPPDGKMVDHGAVTRDAVNGMSDNDIYKKMNKGEYDVLNK